MFYKIDYANQNKGEVMIVYLDNSATTRQYDKVSDEMLKIMKENYGNPSSLHSIGLNAEKLIRGARKILANSLGAKEEEVYFTSGGTESDNTVLQGIADARKRSGKKIITSKVEHPAVLEACKRLVEQGFEVEYIGVDKNCNLNIEELKSKISSDTILISIMAVNNENGTIEPLRDIVQIKNDFNKNNGTDILFHTDAVQSFGKMNMNIPGIDLISTSGHKIHGPKGVGGLYIRNHITMPAFIVGGGQEKHMRSGTENVPAIVGFGLAIDMAINDIQNRAEKMTNTRNYLLNGLKTELSDLKINSIETSSTNGKERFCAPSILNVSFLGTRGEVILHTLEQDNIFVSTGSACASNKKGQSHVLKAMGLTNEEIEGAIRFSFNEFNTIEEMDYVLEKVKIAVTKFRRLGSFR